MIRLLALVSYVYQSAAAIVLIFSISHILPSADYTHFSLVLASSQLLCVFMFEWLQLAGLRFLAAAKGEDAARLRWSLFAAGLLSALALVLIGSAAAVASTLASNVVILGMAVAVLQGLTDLYFTAIRLSDRLGAASFLLILRASLLLAGAVSGAAWYGTTEATLAGIAFGHATGLTAGLIAHRTPLRRLSRGAMLADWVNFSRYGMLAAGASVIHLSVPVMIRFIVVGRLGATGASAGFSLALDLLQRPFWVLIAAIHTVNYPDVVERFERGPDRESKQATARLFDFVICATAVMLGGLVGFIPDAGHILVPPGALQGFLAVAPAAAVFYFLHTNLQATLAIIPHLQKSATRLVIVALCQLALVSAFSAIAVASGFSSSGAVAAASLATALVIVSASGPTIRFGAIPRWPLVLAAAAAALSIASLSAAPTQPPIWLVGKIVLSAMVTACIAWRGDFLMMARRD